jgi:ATP-dependent Lon protease
MKILYPNGAATADEIEELLALAMECRRRVREHILRIDDTFKRHDFIYRRLRDNKSVTVLTPEEVQYPSFASAQVQTAPGSIVTEPDFPEEADTLIPAVAKPEPPQATHIVVPENTRGWSYERLFAKYLRGANSIVIRDPYIRQFYQTRNLMEFLQMVHGLVAEGDEVAVHLVTQSDPEPDSRQEENLNQIAATFTGSKVAFTWEFDGSPNFHARSITTDTGWKISLDRGLDIFQKYESGPFSLEQGIQEARLTRGTDVTYIRESAN